MKKALINITACLIAGALFLGCASHEIRVLNPERIDAYRFQASSQGLTIAAEPFTTKEKVEASFTLDLTEQGYCPILLVMENHSSDNYLLIKDGIELVDNRGNVHKPIPANVMVEKFEHNKMAYALLGFGIFSYMSAEEANKKMQSDWSSKELPGEKVLIPNRKSHGVVYFDMGPGLSGLPNGQINIPVSDMRTGEMGHFKIRFAENIPVPTAQSETPR